MLKKIAISSIFISTLTACGGGAGGSGKIDYSSPNIVDELQAQLSLVDPSVSVSQSNDGKLVLARGSDVITIGPGSTTATAVEFSGVMYGLVVDPEGKYTYSPYKQDRALSDFHTSAISLLDDMQVVSEILGTDTETNLIDLTTGAKNESALPAPDKLIVIAEGKLVATEKSGDATVSVDLLMDQQISLDHNFVDSSVKAAHDLGWDGSGVRLTILDDTSDEQYYLISQQIDLDINYGGETENYFEVIDDEVGLTHSDLVSGIAMGLDWKGATEQFYGLSFNDNCSGSVDYSSSELQDLLEIPISGVLNTTSNYCRSVGVATGSESEVISHSEIGWGELIKQKNLSGSIEILNFSFGNSAFYDLGFSDNHNVVIVNSAGNESGLDTGYDIYADGKSPNQAYDPDENMEIYLTESEYSDNLVAVGALAPDGSIAHYSTIAGPDYDGSSFAFVVDDGTLILDMKSETFISGDITADVEDEYIEASIAGSIKESLTIGEEGTSFAAPRVSGKIAIASQKFPNLNAEQLVNLAKRTAIDLGRPGVDEIYGHGKINVTGMLLPIGRLK